MKHQYSPKTGEPMYSLEEAMESLGEDISQVLFFYPLKDIKHVILSSLPLDHY